MKKNHDMSEKSKLIVLNDFFADNDIIFYYNNREDLNKIFRPILESLKKSSGHLSLYVYPRDMDKLGVTETIEKINLFYMPMLERKYKKLFDEDIKNFEKRILNFLKGKSDKGKKIHLLIDFENLVSAENIELIIGLKDKLRKAFEDSLVNQIYFYNVNSLDGDIIERLSAMGEKFVVASNREYMIFSPRHPSKAREVKPLDLLSQTELEACVKNSLDSIIYSILKNSSMCGFDIIKYIVQNFNILLSQSTVYPILYNLTEEGYLTVKKKEDNKTRIYSSTDEGERFFNEKIKDYIQSQDRVNSFIINQAED